MLRTVRSYLSSCYNRSSKHRILAFACEYFLPTVCWYWFQAQPFARQLLENRQGGQLRELEVFRGKSPQEHTLAEIVIHTSAALQCVGSGSLAQPLYTLMTDPSAMKVSVIT